MNAGYLLAVPLTILLLVGAIRAVSRLVREPSPEWFLCAGILFAFGFGILLMSLKIASYAQVKSFYALPALVPMCAIGVMGWELLAKRGRLVVCVGGSLLASWAAVSYASFWIRPGNPMTHIMLGVGLADEGKYDPAIAAFSRALELDPTSRPARLGIADSQVRLGKRAEAAQSADLALRDHPGDGEALAQVAVSKGLAGDYAGAAAGFQQSLKVAPDRPETYLQLAACYTHLNRMEDLAMTCRQGLRVNPFSPDLHYSLGLVLGSLGQWEEAATQYRYAVAFAPEKLEALNNLAWILAANAEASLRNGKEAVALAQKACALSQNREPVFLGTLAAAYAEAGDFTRAVSTAEQAQSIARSAGLGGVAEKNGELLQLYRAGKAYHESAAPPR
jgi:tetratricopeptide (TPR) repeat protein